MRRLTLVLALALLPVLAWGQAPPTITYPAGSYTLTFSTPVQIVTTEHSVTFTWGVLPPQPIPPGPNPIPIPPVPPKPTPIPPTPTPAPIPLAGLRVLMLYESEDLGRYPPAQYDVLFNQSMRDYLNAKCILGPDNITHEFRIWDKDVNAAGAAKQWQDALARPHPTLPWIVISNGTAGTEGPLPGSTAETIAMIKPYEVPSAAPGPHQ